MAEALDPAIPDNVDHLANVVLHRACEHELRLVTAESCTGGLLAAMLTDIPGCSHAFERGFVTYTNEAKHEVLGVGADMLEDPGPVSDTVARAMAEGALARSRGDLALAITGFAEKDPASDQPGGLVHFALASRSAPTALVKEHFGDIGRARVRINSLETGLGMLLKAVSSQAATRR